MAGGDERPLWLLVPGSLVGITSEVRVHHPGFE